MKFSFKKRLRLMPILLSIMMIFTAISQIWGGTTYAGEYEDHDISTEYECNHDYTYKEHRNDIAPTCTEYGSYDIVELCQDCGDQVDAVTISVDPTGHIFDQEQVEEKYLKSAATCTHSAEYYVSCSKCDASSQGAGDKEAAFESGKALGHKYGAWTKLDADKHQRVCERDAAHIEKENHKWDAGTVTKDATEETEGIRTYTCTVCNATKTETIPTLADAGTTKVPIKSGEIAWLKEESNGSSAWYGLDNRENVFPENSIFWVRWINKESDPEAWEKYYGMLDEEHKNKVEKDRLEIFLCGVRDPSGEEIQDFGGKTVDLYIQLGSDWDKNDIQAVFIDGSDDEDVKVEFLDNFDGPEGTGEYAKLTLKHFSPYAVYDSEKGTLSDALVEGGNNTGFISTGDEIYLAVGTLVFISLVCSSLMVALRKRKTV